MHIVVEYKHTPLEILIDPELRVTQVFDAVQEVFAVGRTRTALIVRGAKLSPLRVAKDVLRDGDKVLLVGSTEAEVEKVQQARPDPLVKGFDELERDEKRRRIRAKQYQQSAWGTQQDKEFKFCSLKAEFKYTTPTPYEAEAKLRELATDPGIIHLMTSRRFVVGELTEMSPMEAQERMARKGQVGVDLLGYNENAGARIVLRVRTDDVKGFRPYYDLMNTLIHELTHNVFGPHDDNFWRLFRELKADYDRFHDGYSRNGRTVGAAGAFAGFDGDDSEDEMPSGGRVGGAILDTDAAREQAAQQAEKRFRQRNASAETDVANVSSSQTPPKPPSDAFGENNDGEDNSDDGDTGGEGDRPVTASPDGSDVIVVTGVSDDVIVLEGSVLSTAHQSSASQRSSVGGCECEAAGGGEMEPFSEPDTGGGASRPRGSGEPAVHGLAAVRDAAAPAGGDHPTVSSDAAVADSGDHPMVSSDAVAAGSGDHPAVNSDAAGAGSGDHPAVSSDAVVARSGDHPVVSGDAAVTGSGDHPTVNSDAAGTASGDHPVPVPVSSDHPAVGSDVGAPDGGCCPAAGGDSAAVADGAAGAAVDAAVFGDAMEHSGVAWMHAFQAEVRRLPPDVLTTLRRLAMNLKTSLSDPKYRRVRGTTPKMERLESCGGDNALRLLGFRKEDQIWNLDDGHVDSVKFYMAAEVLSDSAEP